MKKLNPYRFAFFLVLAATVAVGVLEISNVLVHGGEFDALSTLSLSLMLIPLYVMKKRAGQCTEASFC